MWSTRYYCQILNKPEISPKIPDFIKIRSVEAQLFQADGRTDGWTWRIETVEFRNFAKAPNKY